MAVEELDVLIVGAGLSGIGAAVRLASSCPQRRYTLFESRDAIGGTWDLFRFPGIRSDSDMFTLSYPFRPWKGDQSMAEGASILAYIRDTAVEFGVTEHIRFRHRATAARWSSAEARWTVDVEIDGAPAQFRCRFLYLCTGYYAYDRAHEVDFPGKGTFRGRVVHPQWWPTDLDTTGQRVVIIGSGATAVTMLPALAAQAAHVTMVQRSPTWIAAWPARDAIADRLRAVLPERVAHAVNRWRNASVTALYYEYCRHFPRSASRILLRDARARLPPGYPVEEHFLPRYAPWDQRLCLAPEGDFFDAIASGRASVVTAGIETFTASGLRLRDGREVDADVIVTATGLQVVAFGGMTLTVDQVPVDVPNAFVYKGAMLSGVPNAAWTIGYTNASWTLRSDLSAQYVCRVLNHMDAHGFTRVLPRPDVADLPRRPVMDLTSGYLQRATAHLPQQSDRAPWRVRQNYLLDWPEVRLGPVESPDLRFA